MDALHGGRLRNFFEQCAGIDRLGGQAAIGQISTKRLEDGAEIFSLFGALQFESRVRSSERRALLARGRSVLFWMIAERCSNAGSILDNFVLLHPDIELLDFGNPKVL